MGGWQEATAADGRSYYYHTDTRETRWDKPDDFEAPPKHNQAEVDAAWREATAPDTGKVYYYNVLTKATTWEAPPNYKKPQANARPPSAGGFVAGRAQHQEDDNYRPRDRRRDDRDHGLPQKPNFDGGRGGGMPWDRRQEESGYRGAMPVKTDEPEYSTYEQAEEAFFKMLRKHNISPDTTWEDAMRQVIRERDYRALKDPSQRKIAFEKYCVEVRAEEKDKERERREKLKEEFRKMLNTHDDIKHFTRWKTARPIIEREAVFKSAGDDDDRRQMFDEYIIELKKKHAKEESVKHHAALRSLDVLLHELITDPNTKWTDAQQRVMENDDFVNDDIYRPLSKFDVLTAFDAHIKTLDKTTNDLKQEDKRMQARQERKARDQFKQLLHQMQRQGHIKAGTKWKDFHPLISDDERYLNLIGLHGSNPLDLFWDVVESEEDKLRSLRTDALDVLDDKRYEMTMDTTLSEFVQVMRSDGRTSEMNNDALRFVYDKLMDKIKQRAEADRASSERHQKKAIDALRSVIKHLDPPVRITDTYEDVVPRLQSYEEFEVLGDNKARRSAFDKHIRRLKEKEEDIERERARRDGDRDHRNSSRRDRDRRHRSRSPEVDAYEADRRKAQADRERQYRKPSFGLSPPHRERRDSRDERYRRHDRHDGMSVYDRERREREMERERSYVSRADPRDKGRPLDYGDEDGGVSGQGSGKKRRSDSDASINGRRDVKRPRRMRTKTPEPTESAIKEDSPALQSGSEEGEIEEVL